MDIMDIKDIKAIINQAPVLGYVLLLIGALVLFVAFQVVYNVYFHPLRKFPGPLANKLSIIYTILLGSFWLHY